MKRVLRSLNGETLKNQQKDIENQSKPSMAEMA